MKSEPDSQALAEAVNALMAGMGRGGLTWIAERLGMSPSAMRKRLLADASFDAPTMRAVILLERFNDRDFAGFPIISTVQVGNYTIRVRNVNGEPTPTWDAVPHWKTRKRSSRRWKGPTWCL